MWIALISVSFIFFLLPCSPHYNCWTLLEPHASMNTLFIYYIHTILISELIFFRFFVRFTWVLISSLLSGKFYLLAKSESTFLLYCLHFIVLLYIYFRIFFSFSSLCFLLPIKEYKNPAKPFFLLVSLMFTVKVFCNIKWRDDL